MLVGMGGCSWNGFLSTVLAIRVIALFPAGLAKDSSEIKLQSL